MKEGSRLVVSTGEGQFSCYFLNWIGNTTKIKAINKFGGIVTVDQCDVLEFFI